MVFLRRRLGVGTILLSVVVVIVLLATRAPGHTQHRLANVGTAPTTPLTTTTTTPPRFETSLAPWQLPAPLSRTVALAIGGQIGLFGGLGPRGVTTGAIVELDPNSGKSRQLGALASPVHDAAGAVIGGRYFVFGGGAQTLSARVQAVAVDASGIGASTSSVVASLAAPRADLAAATSNGSVLLVGGYDGTKWSPTVLETSDGSKFDSVAQLPMPVRYPAVAVVGHTLYVIGGELSGNQADAAIVQQVDLNTRAAAVVGHLSAGLSHAVATMVHGTVYVFGGRSGGHAVDTIETLDPSTGALQTVGHLPVSTSDMAAVTIGDTAYVLGGEGDKGQPLASVVVARVVAGR
jgi:non-specific serine/threonine protein kinase